MKKKLQRKEECGFIFSCFTAQCAIEIRTFVVLHYYISIFVVTVDFLFIHQPSWALCGWPMK